MSRISTRMVIAGLGTLAVNAFTVELQCDSAWPSGHCDGLTSSFATTQDISAPFGASGSSLGNPHRIPTRQHLPYFHPPTFSARHHQRPILPYPCHPRLDPPNSGSSFQWTVFDESFGFSCEWIVAWPTPPRPFRAPEGRVDECGLVGECIRVCLFVRACAPSPVCIPVRRVRAVDRGDPHRSQRHAPQRDLQP